MASTKQQAAWPSWTYYPYNTRAPEWVRQFLDAVEKAQDQVETTEAANGLTSDGVLAALADGLRELGYVVESGKTMAGKVLRPVLFGENGVTTVQYEVDAAHDELGVVVEVEAGRGARNNAAYRDVIRASLILDARYLVLLMPLVYRIANSGSAKITSVLAYRDARDMLTAIYASQRLRLPFDGVLLVGY